MATNITTPPSHSNRVQAWVYAIMNPLIESLEREASLLSRGDLTWRFHSKKCEYIRPIRRYIDSLQWPNYEDFVADSLNPRFEASFEEHDRQVAEVESSAERFARGLMQSNLFLSQVGDALKEYESRARAESLYPDLDSAKEGLPRWVVEFLVNRTDSLPDHYLAHQFWEDNRSGFWELYRSEFEPYCERHSFQSLQGAARALQDISSKLLADLKTQRQFLCRTYDIPFAPIQVNQGHSVDAFIS